MVSLREAVEIVVRADGRAAVNEFHKVAGEAKQELGKVEGSSKSMSQKFTLAGVGMVTAAAGIGAGLFHIAELADQAEVAHLKLENTIKNVPSLAHANIKAFDDQSKAIENSTVVNHSAVTGIQALLGQFGLTQTQILGLTPLVVDLSRKMGIDTTVAAKAVGKAVEGSGGSLARFGIKLDVVKGGANNLGIVMQGLGKRVGGFANTEGKTFTGRLDIMKNKIKDLEEGVGVGVVDAFSHALGPITKVSSAFADLDPQTQSMIGKFGTIATAAVGVIGGLSLIVGQAAKMKDRFTDAEGGLTSFGKAAKATAYIAGAVAIFEAYKDVLIADKVSAYDAAAASKTFAQSLDVSSVSAAKSAVDELSKSLQDWFRTNASGVAAEQAGTLLLQNAHVSYTDLSKAITGTGSAYDHLIVKYPLLKAGGDQVKSSIDGLQTALQEQSRQTLISLTATGQLAPALADAATKMATSKDGTVNYFRALQLATGQSKSFNEAQGATAESSKAAATAISKTVDAVKNLHDTERAAATGVLDYADAVAGVADKQKAYNDAVKANGKGSAEAQQAYRDLQRQLIDVGGAADATKGQIAAAGAAVAGSRSRTQDLIGSLQGVANTLAPGSPLRVWLDQYIWKLAVGIPKSVNTVVDVSYRQSVGGTSVGGVVHRASGGPVMAGRPYIVGEHRPELFVPNQSGTIIPRVSAGGGGGNTYIINDATDPDRVVRAIKKYEQRNGKGWRN